MNVKQKFTNDIVCLDKCIQANKTNTVAKTSQNMNIIQIINDVK